MFKFITDWYNKRHEAKQAIIARRFQLQIMKPQVVEDETNFYCAVRALIVADSSTIHKDEERRAKFVDVVLKERDYLIDSCYHCYGVRYVSETNYHIEKVYLDLCGFDADFAEVADKMYPFFEKIEEKDEA